jgi:hypothetical protein
MTIVDSVQDVIDKTDYTGSQFYREYQKTAAMYQELLNKGLTSKRTPQLLSVSDMSVAASAYFNYHR